MALGTDGLLTVVGDVDTITDGAAAGTLTVRLSDVLVVGNKRYAPIDQQVNLNPNDGTFSVKLPPVGDTGITYRFELVAYAYVNGQREHFEEIKDVHLTADLGDAQGIVQYNALAPVATPGVPTTFLTRSLADSRYLLKTDIPELPSNILTEDNIGEFLEPVDLTGYATTQALQTAISQLPSADLSGFILSQAYNPDSLAVTGAITRDSNGVATGFDVTWADGASGRYTGTATAQGTSGYTITHVLAGATTTYTQPTMTRDAAGAVTNRPAVTVTSGTAPVTPVIPVAPTLSVTSKTDTQVVLAGSGGTNVASLVVKRGATTIGTALPVTDTGLTAATAYTYTATATSSTGDTATSTLTVTTNSATVTPITPTADTLTATAGAAGSGQITVAGTGGANVISRALYRGTSSPVATTGTPVATALPFTDTGRVAGTAYFYVEVVTSSTGNTATSNTVTATVAAGATPTVPTTAPTLTLGTSTVTTQPATSTQPSDATAVQYEHKASSGSTWTVDTTGGGTSYTYAGLTASTSYDFRSAGINAQGVGPYSAVVTKSTAASGGSQTTLFTDDFNRADATSLGNGWLDASNMFQIVSQQAAPRAFSSSTTTAVYAMQPTPAAAGSLLRASIDAPASGLIGTAATYFGVTLCEPSATDFTERYAFGFSASGADANKMFITKVKSSANGGNARLAIGDLTFPTGAISVDFGFTAINGSVATLSAVVTTTNGTFTLTATDDPAATPISGTNGYPILTGRYYGMQTSGSTSAGSNTNARADNFRAYTI